MNDLIYFDNSATTKIDSSVLESYQKVCELLMGNPSSLHGLGTQAAKMLMQAREQIADLMGVASEEIFFTSGGTESDNWAIKGTAIEKRAFGNHLITTQVEHPAVIESMKQLELLGYQVTYLPVDQHGIVDLKVLKESITDQTILVSVMAVNNEMGAIQPLKEISEILKDYPQIHFHVDAVQAIGHLPFNLSDYPRIDLASFSAHKFHGPRGMGFLYKKKGRQIVPILTGGGQESGLRSSTENLPGIVAMSKALRLALTENSDHLVDMRRDLVVFLNDFDQVNIFSNQNGAPHIICFGIEGVRGEVLVHALESKGIYVSTTSACSSRAGVESSTLLAMGFPQHMAETAIRVSFSPRNTLAELSRFQIVFKEIYQNFMRLNRGSEA